MFVMANPARSASFAVIPLRSNAITRSAKPSAPIRSLATRSYAHSARRRKATESTTVRATRFTRKSERSAIHKRSSSSSAPAIGFLHPERVERVRLGSNGLARRSKTISRCIGSATIDSSHILSIVPREPSFVRQIGDTPRAPRNQNRNRRVCFRKRRAKCSSHTTTIQP